MFENMTDSVVLFILFLVVANPVVYKMVDQILSTCGLDGYIFESDTLGVSMMAVALHALVFVGVYQLYKTTMTPPEGFTEGDEHEDDFMENPEDIGDSQMVFDVEDEGDGDEDGEQPGPPEQEQEQEQEQQEQPGQGPPEQGQPGQGGESPDLGGFEGFSSSVGSAF